MKKTNFDLYLEEQLKEPVFARRFASAGEAWDAILARSHIHNRVNKNARPQKPGGRASR